MSHRTSSSSVFFQEFQVGQFSKLGLAQQWQYQPPHHSSQFQSPNPVQFQHLPSYFHCPRSRTGVTFQNGPQLVLEWCLNSLVTFKTVKRFGNKKYKVWCSMVKIPSRSKSEYCSRCFICQLLNILVFCRTSVGVSQWLRSSCARASYRHSSSRFVKVHPWKDLSQSLCRFWSQTAQSHIRHLISPTPNSIW